MINWNEVIVLWINMRKMRTLPIASLSISATRCFYGKLLEMRIEFEFYQSYCRQPFGSQLRILGTVRLIGSHFNSPISY